MMAQRTVQLIIEDKIALITIHRPEALNALNRTVVNELESALRQLASMDHDSLRVLIITGGGEKSFVAGADIKEIHQLSPTDALKFAEQGQRILREIEKLKVPVIAAVNGFALGGGLELALACDFIYASENAKLGLPEVGLGLIPGFGGTVRLSRAIGPARAKEMILSAMPLSATEALQVGLVNKVLPPAELMTEVRRLATVIAGRGPVALDLAKRSIQETAWLPIDEAMNFEARQFSNLFKTADVFEGTKAFIDKRKPLFQGR
jgi:enoyl-CoA hydratase